jgi:hypothetical protein
MTFRSGPGATRTRDLLLRRQVPDVWHGLGRLEGLLFATTWRADGLGPVWLSLVVLASHCQNAMLRLLVLRARLARVDLPAPLAATVVPLVALLTLQQELAAADAGVAALAASDPALRHLDQVHAIGPVTAAAFVATLDDVTRFQGAHQVQAYLGLVPRERSSGERQHREALTKQGSRRVRWLLVEAAWRLRRSRHPAHAALQAWAARIEGRRGEAGGCGRRRASRRRDPLCAVARQLDLWDEGGAPWPGGDRGARRARRGSA